MKRHESDTSSPTSGEAKRKRAMSSASRANDADDETNNHASKRGAVLQCERDRRNGNSIAHLPPLSEIMQNTSSSSGLQQWCGGRSGGADGGGGGGGVPAEVEGPPPSTSSSYGPQQGSFGSSQEPTAKVNVIDGATGKQYGVLVTASCTIGHLRQIIANVLGFDVSEQALGVGGRDLTGRHLQDVIAADAFGSIFETMEKCSVVVFRRRL